MTTRITIQFERQVTPIRRIGRLIRLKLCPRRKRQAAHIARHRRLFDPPQFFLIKRIRREHRRRHRRHPRSLQVDQFLAIGRATPDGIMDSIQHVRIRRDTAHSATHPSRKIANTLFLDLPRTPVLDITIPGNSLSSVAVPSRPIATRLFRRRPRPRRF